MLHIRLIAGCFVLGLFSDAVLGLTMTNIKHKACKIGPKPLEVMAGPCPSHPCSLKRGEAGQLHLKFIPAKSSNKVVFEGIVVKNKDNSKLIHLPTIDLCKQGFIDCPLEANHTYTIKATGPVPNVVPPGSYAGDVWLQGDYGRLVCLRGLLIIT